MAKKFKRRSLAEKVSFTVSLSIVSTIVILVCYAWATGDTNPPTLTITTSEIRQIDRQYYVPFTVSNSGGETANSVEVTAQLLSDLETIETGTQQIDFLSRKEQRSGEFIFSHDPRRGKLTVRVASYKQP
jgi:uncharacterized protein (TIGR02588 family)